MRVLRLALLESVFVGAIGVAGCGGEDSAPASQRGAPQGPGMQQDSQDTAKDLSPEAQTMMESATNYLEHTKTKVKSLDDGMAKLAAKAEAKGAETKAEYDKTKAEWDVKVKETQAELDRLIVEARSDPTSGKQKAQKAFTALVAFSDEAKKKFN